MVLSGTKVVFIFSFFPPFFLFFFLSIYRTQFKIPQGVNAFDYSERINLIGKLAQFVPGAQNVGKTQRGVSTKNSKGVGYRVSEIFPPLPLSLASFLLESVREMRETTSTRFSQYQVVLLREPTSFWRENVLAGVILLRVVARIFQQGKQVIKFYKFNHFVTGKELNLLQ